MFEIAYDERAAILRLTLAGFWSTATMAQFAAEMVSRATALRTQGKRFAILSDSRAFAIQSPEVSSQFDAMMKQGSRHMTGPFAIVVGSMLNKLQAERTFAGAAHVFTDVDAARDWIAAEWSRRDAA